MLVSLQPVLVGQASHMQSMCQTCAPQRYVQSHLQQPQQAAHEPAHWKGIRIEAATGGLKSEQGPCLGMTACHERMMFQARGWRSGNPGPHPQSCPRGCKGSLQQCQSQLTKLPGKAAISPALNKVFRKGQSTE